MKELYAYLYHRMGDAAMEGDEYLSKLLLDCLEEAIHVPENAASIMCIGALHVAVADAFGGLV